jgi:hypothetical protein
VVGPLEQPEGYERPEFVYVLDLTDDTGEQVRGRVGAFDSEEAALAARHVLVTEDPGRFVHVSPIPVHQRVEDWEHDR